jgi:hypothetical protein
MSAEPFERKITLDKENQLSRKNHVGSSRFETVIMFAQMFAWEKEVGFLIHFDTFSFRIEIE